MISLSLAGLESGPSQLMAITGAQERRSNTQEFVLRRLLISPQYCHLVINEALLLLQPHWDLRHGRRTSCLSSVISGEVRGELRGHFSNIILTFGSIWGNLSVENDQ